MTKLNRQSRGFTIIELLIVLIVIGILVAIVFSTYSGIQAKNRNTKRETDIENLQSQLESFYSQNDYYPSLGDINSASWRKTNMPTLNVSYMIDPSSKMTTANVTLAASPQSDVYSYNVTDSSGDSCENHDVNCAVYTLTATFEGTVNGSKTFAKNSLD
jgi:prepilin-type N-terminal cleavage/methylation domain-containing protein